MVIPGDAEGTIRRWQAEIDAKLTAQLRAIMHHPDFHRLEATWRGLNYLVQRTETDESLKIKVLNTGKAELAQSTAAAVRTQLDRGEPVRLLVADLNSAAGRRTWRSCRPSARWPRPCRHPCWPPPGRTCSA